MRKPVFSALVTLVAVAVSTLVMSNSRVALGQGRTGGANSNNGPYYVIQIINPPEDTLHGQPGGLSSQPDPYDVLDGKQIKDKQKELEKKYTENYEKWQDEKKLDPKAPRPLKPSIKRLKTFKTKEVADEYRKKLEDELAKKEGDKPQR
jgi:hypothetical protein